MNWFQILVLTISVHWGASTNVGNTLNIEFHHFENNDPEIHYKTYCASCHGSNLEGFVEKQWQYGSDAHSMFNSIKKGYIQDGMPSYDTTFTDVEIEKLVEFIQSSIVGRKKYDFTATQLQSDTFFTQNLTFHLDTVMTGLEIPWGMTWLPTGDLLVTERGGDLYRKDIQGQIAEISGVPKVKARGQGGLMDIEIHPNFEENGWIYLSYSKPQSDQATTAIMRARLIENELQDQTVIFEAQPYSNTRHHYGSRLEFDREGYLYFSVGDRGARDKNPQYLNNHCGKIHRLHDDGSIPADNPFVKVAGAMPSIWSYGHRNPQGISLDPASGDIWVHEHGPRGGDEVNIIQKGKNYGWPVISYGINYNGTSFTDITAKEGMEQPELYWVPSIGPCGSTFVSGSRYPGWEGDFLVGSLSFKYLNRCIVQNGQIVGEEMLLKNIGRVRSVAMGPDDYLYVGVEKPGIIYRLIPIEPK